MKLNKMLIEHFKKSLFLKYGHFALKINTLTFVVIM